MYVIISFDDCQVRTRRAWRILLVRNILILERSQVKGSNQCLIIDSENKSMFKTGAHRTLSFSVRSGDKVLLIFLRNCQSHTVRDMMCRFKEVSDCRGNVYSVESMRPMGSPSKKFMRLSYNPMILIPLIFV